MLKGAVVLVFIEDEAEKCDLFKTIDELGIVCNFEYQKANLNL